MNVNERKYYLKIYDCFMSLSYYKYITDNLIIIFNFIPFFMGKL